MYVISVDPTFRYIHNYIFYFTSVGRSGGYVCKWHIEAKTNTTGILIRLNIYGRVRGDTIALYEGKPLPSIVVL